MKRGKGPQKGAQGRMQRFLKETGRRIFFLPPLPVLLIAVPAFGLVIYVLTAQIDGLPAYLSYLASAYALIVVLTGFPGMVRSVRQGVQDHPLTRKVKSIPAGRRWTEDAKFRAKVSLYQGLAVDLLYIALKLASGILYQSVWFVSLAIYYALLAAMRFLLLYRIRAADEAQRRNIELRRYRLCGIVLLLMDQALAGVVLLMVHQNRGYEYPGMLIYAMAAYSFYAIAIAAVNVVKFRKHGSPVLSAAKAVDLVAAMVSMLSLETAMLARFGGEDGPQFRKRMTETAGFFVCVIVLGMAVFMIVRSTKCIRRTERKGTS